jgi:hypothetical protein
MKLTPTRAKAACKTLMKLSPENVIFLLMFRYRNPCYVDLIVSKVLIYQTDLYIVHIMNITFPSAYFHTN